MPASRRKPVLPKRPPPSSHSGPPRADERVTEHEDPPIRILRQGVQIAPFAIQLEQHPELWDRNVFRTMGGYGPHAKLHDIILRFNDWKNWTGDRVAFNAMHESVWWKAYDVLGSVKPLVFDLMRLYEAEQLGMVLVTKIPPHTTCERHVDVGWHAQHYIKFAVQIKAAKGQRFCFDGYSVETKPGDLFVFNNQKAHWVENPTDEERITLIICLRTKQPTCTDCEFRGPN